MYKETKTVFRCQFCDQQFSNEDDCLDHEYSHLEKKVTITELINIIEKFYNNSCHRINSDSTILSEGGTPTSYKIMRTDMDGTPVSPSSILLKLAYIVKNKIGDIEIKIDDDIDTAKYEPLDREY